MSEVVKTYLLDDPDVMIPMDRNEFYKEQVEIFKKTGKPTRSVEIVNIFLFDETGELFVQKRSHKKAHNPGLLDKSIGGHVQEGDETNYTVMVETIQELQVPSVVLRTDDDFIKTYNLLKEYLNTVAIIKHVDTEIYQLERQMGGEMVKIANKLNLYFGVYGGRVKTVDREVKGVLQYSLKELDEEIEEVPQTFTYDLKFLVKKYRKELENFIKILV